LILDIAIQVGHMKFGGKFYIKIQPKCFPPTGAMVAKPWPL